jgi:hypothetical protein
MLINEIKPLGTDVQLELDLLERALETGVIVEYEPVPLSPLSPLSVEEDHVDTLLGGLIRAEEPVHAHEANLRPTSPTSAPDTAKAPRRSAYVPRRSGGRGRPK